MTVRAKFRLSRIERSLMDAKVGVNESGNAIWGMVEVQTLVMHPVMEDASGENSKFFASTPSGEIKLGTINAAAASEFDLNGEYYVDFTPASKES